MPPLVCRLSGGEGREDKRDDERFWSGSMAWQHWGLIELTALVLVLVTPGGAVPDGFLSFMYPKLPPPAPLDPQTSSGYPGHASWQAETDFWSDRLGRRSEHQQLFHCTMARAAPRSVQLPMQRPWDWKSL